MGSLIDTPHGTAADPGGRTPSPRWVLAGLSLAMLLSSLGTSVANVALPTLAQAFGTSFHAVQWIVIIYLLAVTVLIVWVGGLGDVVGRRRLLLAGIGLFTVASIVCFAAPALWVLIAARAAQGVGAAIMMALTLAIVGDAVPRGQTGRAMGLLGATSAFGTALGPSLGGALIAFLGWRPIFLVNVPLGVTSFILAWRHLPSDRIDAQIAPRLEWRSASPVLQLSAFRDPLLRSRLLANALVSTVMMATLVVGPFYLTGALRLDSARVGLVLSAGPVVAAMAGVPSGRLTDLAGTHQSSIIGLAAMVVGAGLLSALPPALGVAGYVAPIVVVTMGYALFQAANNAAVISRARPSERGVVGGLLSLSRNLGLVAGASVMGAVFALGTRAPEIGTAQPEAISKGMRITFAVAAVLILGALALVAAPLARPGAVNPARQRSS